MDVTVAQKYFHRENDLISIIIPCYNREDYIEECLDSIFSQTVPPSLYEVICVDDGSTDSTVAIIKQYEEKYPDQLLLIECDENSGGYIGKVRNIGMQYASGTYLLFVDSDDYLAPNYLEKLYLGALISQAEVVSCGYSLFDETGVIWQSDKQEFVYNTDNLLHYKGLQKKERFALFITKLYSSGFLKQYGITFPTCYRLSEDTFFTDSILNHVHTYYVIPDCLYYYRQTPGSACHDSNIHQYVMDLFWVQISIYQNYCSRYKSFLYEKYHDYFDDFYYTEMYATIIDIKEKLQKADKTSYFQEIKPTIESNLYKYYPNIDKVPEILSLLETD